MDDVPSLTVYPILIFAVLLEHHFGNVFSMLHSNGKDRKILPLAFWNRRNTCVWGWRAVFASQGLDAFYFISILIVLYYA